MQKKSWLSGAVFIGISVAGAVMLIAALVSTSAIFFGGEGFLSWFALLLLIFVASRFTVSVTSNDGQSESKKSLADTFVFLAVMIFAIPPAGTPGPAIILAGIVGFLSTFSSGNRRQARSHNRNRHHFYFDLRSMLRYYWLESLPSSQTSRASDFL